MGRRNLRGRRSPPMCSTLLGALPPLGFGLPQGAVDGKWTEVLKDLPMVSLKPSSTFGVLIDTIASQGLHRIYITSEAGAPVSIVTLTDVLREIIKPDPPKHHFQRLGSNLPEDTEEDEDDEDDDEEETETKA